MNIIEALWKDFSESNNYLANCTPQERTAHKETFYNAVLSFINLAHMEVKMAPKESETAISGCPVEAFRGETNV